MTLLLGPNEVASCLNYQVVTEALLEGFQAEGQGRLQMPARITIPAPSGWFRGPTLFRWGVDTGALPEDPLHG